MSIFSKIFITAITISFTLGFFNVALAGVDPPSLSQPIGDFDSSDFGSNPGDWIGQYIAAIYRYGVGIAAFLAVVMMMVGGLIWLTSAGKRGQIETGQDFIKSALLGLLLAMFSFILLFTINPRLTIFQPLDIPSPDLPEREGSGTVCCHCALVDTLGVYSHHTCEVRSAAEACDIDLNPPPLLSTECRVTPGDCNTVIACPAESKDNNCFCNRSGPIYCTKGSNQPSCNALVGTTPDPDHGQLTHCEFRHQACPD